MKKTECVINQLFEIGDIMYIEPIYRWFHDNGYEVVAPVRPEYLWIKDYIPYVRFEDASVYPYDYEVVDQPGGDDGRVHIPLRFAHPLYRGYELHYGDDRQNWMCDKYLFLGLDKELWRTMKFDRKLDREEALFKKLGIEGEYNLVNEHFGGSFERVPITVNNSLPCIYMKKTDDYTLLDWLTVVQRATNIYTVETSLVYLIEAHTTIAKEFHLYPRYPFLEHVNYMKQYLSKNWTLHDSTNL